MNAPVRLVLCILLLSALGVSAPSGTVSLLDSPRAANPLPAPVPHLLPADADTVEAPVSRPTPARRWPSDWPALVPFAGPGERDDAQNMGARVDAEIDGEDPFAGLDDIPDGEPGYGDEFRPLTLDEQIDAIDRILQSGENDGAFDDGDPFAGLDDVPESEPGYDDDWGPLTAREQLELIDEIVGEGEDEDQDGADGGDAGDEDPFAGLDDVPESESGYGDDWRPLTAKEQIDAIDQILQDGEDGDNGAPGVVDEDGEDPFAGLDDLPESEPMYDEEFRPLTPQEQLELMDRILLDGEDEEEEPFQQGDLNLPQVDRTTSEVQEDPDDPFGGLFDDLPEEEQVDEWMDLTPEQRRRAIEEALQLGDEEEDQTVDPSDDKVAREQAFIDALVNGDETEDFADLSFEDKVRILQERFGEGDENPFADMIEKIRTATTSEEMSFEERKQAIEEALGIDLDASDAGGPDLDGASLEGGTVAFNRWLRDALNRRLASLEGERDEDGLLVKDDMPLQGINLIGLFLIQDAVVAQLNNFAARLRAIQGLSDGERTAVARDLVKAASALQDAYANMHFHEPSSYRNGRRYSPEAAYEAWMKEAEQLRSQGRIAEADEALYQARTTPYGIYLHRQHEFYSLLDQHPILGILRDTYAPFDEAYLFEEIFHEILNTQFDSTRERNQRLLEILDEYLQIGIDNSVALANELQGVNELDDLLEFGGPKYQVIQDQLIQGAEALDQGYIRGIVEGAREQARILGEVEAEEELWRNILIYSAAAGTSIILPGASGMIFAIVFSGVDAAYEGVKLIRIELEAGEAEQLAVVGGFEHLGPMYEEMVGDQWRSFGLAVLFGLADISLVYKVKSLLAERRAIRNYAEEGARRLMPDGTPAQQRELARRIERSLLSKPRSTGPSTAAREADDAPSSGIGSEDETLGIDSSVSGARSADDVADGARGADASDATLRDLDPLAEFGDDAPAVLFREFATQAARRFLPEGSPEEVAELAERIEATLRRAQRGRDAAAGGARQVDEVGDETLRDVAPGEDTLPYGASDVDEATEMGIPSTIRRNLQRRVDAEDAAYVGDELAEQIDLARQAGVSEDTIHRITGGFDPHRYASRFYDSALRAAEELAIARLRHQGYEIVEFVEAGQYVYRGHRWTRWVVPEEGRALWNEALRVRAIYVRARGEGLTPDDIAWLTERLAEDPQYFRNLLRRGFSNPETDEVFDPILEAQQAWQLRRLYHRATAEAGDAAAPLLSRGEYDGLLARQTGGETLDLADVPRPGIARVTDDGEIVIVQGAGRHDRTSPDDLVDLFVRTGTRLPEGIEVQILEEGVDPEIVRAANLLSSRGPEGANPDLIGVLVGDAPSFTRIRVRARDARALMSDVQHEVRTLRDQLRSHGADMDAIDQATGGMSPLQQREFLREEARSAGLSGGAALGAGATGATLDPGSESASIGGPSGRGGDDRELEVVVVSRGGSTGEVLDMYVVNNGKPVKLEGEFALEPVDESDLTPAQRSRMEEIMQAASAGKTIGLPPFDWLRGEPSMPPVGAATLSVSRLTLEAYCLEHDLGVPTEGMLFRIADPDKQRSFASSLVIMRAARAARDAGELDPDSDPEGYYHSITQWAIWVDEKDFDESGFEDAFVDHTKRNFEAAGQPWSDDVETLVRELAPNRWEDIRQILDRAGVPS